MFTKIWFEELGKDTGKYTAWLTAKYVKILIFIFFIGVVAISWPYVGRPGFYWACSAFDNTFLGGHTVTCKVGGWTAVGVEGLGAGLEKIVPDTGGGGGENLLPDFSFVEYGFPAPIETKLLRPSTNVYETPNGALIGIWISETNGETVKTVAMTQVENVKWVKIPWASGFGWILATDITEAELPTEDTLQQSSLQELGPWDNIPDDLLGKGLNITDGTYLGWTAVSAWKDLRGVKNSDGTYNVTIGREEMPVVMALYNNNIEWETFGNAMLYSLNIFEKTWWTLRSGEVSMGEAKAQVLKGLATLNGAGINLVVSSLGEKEVVDMGNRNVFVMGTTQYGGNIINLNIAQNDIKVWVLRAAGFKNIAIGTQLNTGGK